MFPIVMFNGDQYWVIGEVQIQLYERTGTSPEYSTLFELAPVEEGTYKGFFRYRMVSRQSFFYLPSSIKFEFSEWMEGIKNGQTK